MCAIVALTGIYRLVVSALAGWRVPPATLPLSVSILGVAERGFLEGRWTREKNRWHRTHASRRFSQRLYRTHCREE